MRIFGGETMAAWMQTFGMEEGVALESKLLSRRIMGCQKKVEEKNFDIRKNLLDYDEVMDLQRKRIYGFRQGLLENASGKLIIQEMLTTQIGKTIDRCLNPDYAAETFAVFASQELGCEFEASDFRRSTYDEADQTAKDKAEKQAIGAIEDALDENLPAEAEPHEWNWVAFGGFLSRQFGLRLSDRELKKIGRERIIEEVLPEAEKAIAAVDLSRGRAILDPAFGRQSIIDWARLKFRLNLEMSELEGVDRDGIKKLLLQKIAAQYAERETDFPVQIGMATFMAEQKGAGERYDRDGLLTWAKERFPGAADTLNEEEFRTLSRNRIGEMLRDISKKFSPTGYAEKLESQLTRITGRAPRLSAEQAGELAAWAVSSYQLKVDTADLTGATLQQTREKLLNAFDDRYRPEMRAMERSLVLNIIDGAWKDHLYAMDHLRSGVGLVGYAQKDPKIEYKQQGMKLFDEMWDSAQVKITDLVFRMEEQAESMGDQLLASSTASHQQASSAIQQAAVQRDQQISTGQSGKKIEPIRNKGPKVGRNDPCPCGSGKKYKNCCMKK